MNPISSALSSAISGLLKEKSSQLVRKIATLLEHDDPKLDQSSDSIVADFTVNKIPLILVHSPLAQGERIFLICRFGSVPEERRIAVLDRLLQINFVLSSQPLSFAIDPVTKEAVLTANYFLDDVSAESLAAAMRIAAEHALTWRKTYFLDEDVSAAELNLNHLAALV